MRRILTLLMMGMAMYNQAEAQKLKDILKKPKADSTRQTVEGLLKKVTGSKDSLSTSDVVSGLKQALEIGAQQSSNLLSKTDGFFANAAVKILLPEEARKVEKTLRNMGMGKLADDAILSMNRAAEDAAKSAAPIFKQAIVNMTWQDAWSILRGSDTAATAYLRGSTSSALTEAFRPVISKSIDKVGATKHWNTLFTNYNKFASKKINPDLTAYVTEQALRGIFIQLAQEEKDIRKNPAARTTELLRKVFGSK